MKIMFANVSTEPSLLGVAWSAYLVGRLKLNEMVVINLCTLSINYECKLVFCCRISSILMTICQVKMLIWMQIQLSDVSVPTVTKRRDRVVGVTQALILLTTWQSVYDFHQAIQYTSATEDANVDLTVQTESYKMVENTAFVSFALLMDEAGE